MELNRVETEQAIGRVAGENPDPGTTIERFNAEQLATVLEHEIVKARQGGLQNLRIDMSLVDAAALAKHLRKKGFLWR